MTSFGTFIALGSWWWVAEQGSPTLSLLPQWLMLTWYAILAVSGVLGIAAALWAVAYPSISMLLERAALIGVSGYGFLYVLALSLERGPAITIIVFSLTTIASLWRLRQVQRRIATLRKAGERAA